MKKTKLILQLNVFFGYYRRNLFHLASAICFLFFYSISLNAQQSNIPINHDWLMEIDAKTVQARGFVLDNSLMPYEADSSIRSLIKTSDKGIVDPTVIVLPLHSSMRPWIEQGHPLRKNVAFQNYSDQKKMIDLTKRFPKSVIKYHYQASLFQLERKPQNDEPLFRIYIDPLVNFEYMRIMKSEADIHKALFYVNTRGINAHGDIGTKLSFETSFYENQALYPNYINVYANATKIIPGQGRWKKFKQRGVDYAMATGYLSYSPYKNLNVQIGNGKFFVGDGYRSLLLSDNSFSYPFARFTGWFGPNKMFQYSTIYASLMNLVSDSPIPAGTERLYQKKAASFYQLSASLGRIAEVSLFQGLIWTAADNKNQQSIGLAYVNPLLFSSIPGHGLNDRENFLLGATFHVDLLKTLRLYGQLVIDDFGKKGSARNKNGFQVGLKYFNIFKIKYFHLQLEFNQVQPYTYSAFDLAQAYSHYAQPLAHPYGANFSEFNGSTQYKLGDFYAHLRISLSILGADTAGYDFGQNIFAPTGNEQLTPVAGANSLGQGERTSLSCFDVSVGYMISYASNLNVCVGYMGRKVSDHATIDQTEYVYIAVRTSLTNNYFDFFK